MRTGPKASAVSISATISLRPGRSNLACDRITSSFLEIRGDMSPFIIGFDRLRKTVGDGQVQDGRAVAANAFDNILRRPCLRDLGEEQFGLLNLEPEIASQCAIRADDIGVSRAPIPSLLQFWLPVINRLRSLINTWIASTPILAPARQMADATNAAGAKSEGA